LEVDVVLDLTDGMRPELFPSFPHWVMARMRDGGRLRLAKGGPRELGPLLGALAELGLPLSSKARLFTR
jgi:hypothetical protein